jgi:hypothetical protein
MNTVGTPARRYQKNTLKTVAAEICEYRILQSHPILAIRSAKSMGWPERLPEDAAD